MCYAQFIGYEHNGHINIILDFTVARFTAVVVLIGILTTGGNIKCPKKYVKEEFIM